MHAISATIRRDPALCSSLRPAGQARSTETRPGRIDNVCAGTCLRGRHVGSRTRRCHTHQLVAKSSRTHGFAAASSVLPAPTARRHHTCAIRSTRGETSSAAAVPETRRRRHAGREDANLHTHGRRLRAPPNLATRGAARRVAAATCLERHALAARQGDLDADLAPAQLPHCFRVNTTFCMEKKWAGALASRCRLIEGKGCWRLTRSPRSHHAQADNCDAHRRSQRGDRCSLGP